MNENLNIEEIIEKEIVNNLKIKVTANYYGYINVELLYKGEIISEDTCKVTTDSNPLDD